MLTLVFSCPRPLFGRPTGRDPTIRGMVTQPEVLPRKIEISSKPLAVDHAGVGLIQTFLIQTHASNRMRFSLAA